jgi:hypothetical protein
MFLRESSTPGLYPWSLVNATTLSGNDGGSADKPPCLTGSRSVTDGKRLASKTVEPTSLRAGPGGEATWTVLPRLLSHQPPRELGGQHDFAFLRADSCLTKVNAVRNN